ncbi:MAG: biotin/lipoyl-binding protein, partial [Rikenellaceae bacterium]
MKKYWIIGSVVVAAAVVTFVLLKDQKPIVDLRTAAVENGSLMMTVTATGYIQPVLKVEVGTQVSGIVEKLYVDFNSEVKKGQLLAQLDKSTLKEKVAQSKS